MSNASLVEQLVLLNSECFGAKDWYSDARRVQRSLDNPTFHLLTVTEAGQLLGYYILQDKESHVDGVRLAVQAALRNKKLGTRLIQRALRHAKKRDKPFHTYTLRSNLGSCNLHLRLGMKLSRLDKRYLYLESR
jgi:GNAT superfamily N-acetyltransferase